MAGFVFRHLLLIVVDRHAAKAARDDENRESSSKTTSQRHCERLTGAWQSIKYIIDKLGIIS